MIKNRERLAEHGVVVPPGSWSEGQVFPVMDLLGRKPQGEQIEGTREAWPRFVRLAHAEGGRTVVLSMEFLATARPHHVQRIAEDLQGAELHVVITARDMGRQLPASWQESVQNGAAWPWRRYLVACSSDEPSRPKTHFERDHDLARMAADWREFVPSDRIHLITIPRGAPQSLLWERFCQVMDVNPAVFDLEVAHTNPSLGAASAEVMRLVNKGHGELDRTTALVLKHLLAKGILSGRPDEPRVSVPGRFRSWVVDASRAQVDALRTLDLHVVGDIHDLLTDLADMPADPPPDDRALFEAALDGLVGLTRAIADTRRRGPATADASHDESGATL